MADGAFIEVRTAEFEAAMQAIQRGVQRGLIDPQYGTLPVQARLLAEQCQKYTPPRNKGQGQAAVARDLTRIYAPQSASTYKNKRVRRIVMRDDRNGWNSAARNFVKPLQGTTAIAFSESWHAQNRISRGRASGLANGKRGARANLGVVTLGPQARMAREYIKKVKKMVGWAKAGWNQAILMLGGTVTTEWIARHKMGHGGMVFQATGPNPFVLVSNQTGWAKYNGDEGNRIIRNAVSQRARMMQTFAEGAMARAVQMATDSARGRGLLMGR